MKNVINIVNFIRGWDGRADFDLKTSVIEQRKLAEKYNIPVTFLYQYDAMIQPEYIEILHGCDAKTELGIWIEMSKPLVEAVGLKWRGREGYIWDWHSCVDMTVGYTLEEREIIIDEIMRKFREIFGYYPKTVGSWALDAYSIRYMREQYEIEAVLICKDQWGTDGYFLWGGYYSGAYYPCKNNALCPAQSNDEQIDIPVFRMLGSDPVDQYMSGIGTDLQGIESMEPVCPDSGANPEWVKWYLRETFRNENLGFNYCQAGQENSFGWDAMKDGYLVQMELFKEKMAQGEIEFELVSETAEKYKAQYPATPCTTVEAHKESSSTFWFNSMFYRSNIYLHNKEIIIRDLFVFNEKYKERYFDTITEDVNLYYDNLPIIDCFRWSRDGEIGGGYIKKNEKKVASTKDFTVNKISDTSVCVNIETEDGNIEIIYEEKGITFAFPTEGYYVETITYADKTSVNAFVGNKILCRYCGFEFSVELSDAICEVKGNGYSITPNEKIFELRFE